jgi:SAP domain-containing new25/Domain of unknown function (DUF6434)
MNRPTLSKSLPKTEFTNWYWLKSELVEFCRENGLATSGGKEEIAIRIKNYLGGENSYQTKMTHSTKSKSVMPDSFNMTSVIEKGWRCSQSLRAFFEAEFGTSFRFNEALRTFISTKAGHTLGEAMECYKTSLATTQRPIAKQFEYNTHMREFHKKNLNASHVDAVDSWWKKRGGKNA